MKKTRKKKRNGVNKSEFIRARPTATPDEIIEAAKTKGIEITRDAVHKVRWQAKAEARLHPVKVKTPPTKRGSLIKSVPAKNGNGVDLVGQLAEFDSAAEAALGATVASIIKKVVHAEVRAEVRRIMSAGASVV